MSFQLQVILYPSEISSTAIIRGAKDPKNSQDSKSFSPNNNSANTVYCINHALYNMLRTNRQHRRSLIVNLLALFDDRQDSAVLASENSATQNRLSQLIFIADHLAHFPYMVLDEVYYVADLTEQRISLMGPTILRSFYRSLLPGFQSKRSNSDGSESSKHSVNEDQKSVNENDLMDYLDKCAEKLPREYDLSTSLIDMDIIKSLDNQSSCSSLEKEMQHLFKHCQSDTLKGKARSSMIYSGPPCVLLIAIWKFIREYYGVSYSKLKMYSPSDSSKLFEKPIVLPKHSNLSDQLMTLPLIIHQYACNPAWNDISKGPPDHILLRHFLVLRRELMLHEDSTLDEPLIENTSKSNSQALNAKENRKNDYQMKEKSEEGPSGLCNRSTASKHSKSTSEHCVSTKYGPGSSFDQKRDSSSKSQLANPPRKRKLTKRVSSRSASLSSLSDSSNETVDEITLKKNINITKSERALDQRSQNLQSISVKSHNRLSQRSNYSTDSDSVELNNTKTSRKDDNPRGHQSRLRSSPDSSNKPGFPSQSGRSNFESLDLMQIQILHLWIALLLKIKM
ncbi:unnamed protein product [Heterobilharzia americana]|nr:unnamed protein product [Heterobilharzia americana]